MATYTEAWVSGPHSTNFYTRTYEAALPTALLVNVHGAAEHSGRYKNAHSRLAEQGITVFSYDQRGFGRTALDAEHKGKDSAYGKTNWNAALEDLDWAVQHAHKQHPELPVFIMGSSMGGTLCLGFVARPGQPERQASVALLSGVIASAPTFLLTDRPSWLLHIVAKGLSLVTPYKLVPVKNDPKTKLSSNEETNKAYLEDPLIKTPGSFRSVVDLVTEGERMLNEYYKRWPAMLPLLVLQGSADQTSDPVATQAFFEKLVAGDKKLAMYPDARHELHNEPPQDQVAEECVEFMKRIAADKGARTAE